MDYKKLTELDPVITLSDNDLIDVSVYNGGNWVSNSASIATLVNNSSASTTYLKLDASNDPITGSLQLNSDIHLLADNTKIYLGAGDDVYLMYTGTYFELWVDGILMMHNRGSSTKNIFIGYASGSLATITGEDNSCLGASSLSKITSGVGNTCSGTGSGAEITTGTYNVCIGRSAGNTITTGSNNFCIGYLSGNGITTAGNNMFIGTGAGRGGANASYRVGIGSDTLRSASHGAVAIGGTANRYGSASYTIAIGYEAAKGVSGQSTGAYFTAIGYQSQTAITSGAANTTLGYQTGLQLTTGGYNVLIGYKAGDTLTTESNKLYIANNTGTPLIYGEFDNQLVKVNGDLSATTTTIPACTTTVAPLKFLTGAKLTTAVTGAMEFEYDNLYFTITSGSTTPYSSQYPSSQNATYVKATSTYSSSYYPYFGTDPAKSLTGTAVNNAWLSSSDTNQRFHIDLGSALVIKRIYYENFHTTGNYPTGGVKDFTFWGSNTAGSFDDLTYATDTGWTQIATGSTYFEQHPASDIAEPKYIEATNNVAYRYYAFKFANNYTYAGAMGFRRVELQISNTPNRKNIILDDGTELSPQRIPIVTTNGRLTDSADIIYDGSKLALDTDLELKDNSKIYLGSSDDASIYYDGTNLHIDAQEVGSGNIILDNLPTDDPGIAGAVYANAVSGVLSISFG